MDKLAQGTSSLSGAMFRFLAKGTRDVVPLLGELELMELATAANPSCASSAECLAISGEIFHPIR